ncbi:response regulator transcription factor [Paenibacillus oleatilyticus]|uniref:response regulator transcription factor n=1 Tax=Paenibacillus oleatilyticus TaxID=2594886 RepID=UPI001C1F30DE|nr:response regulator transcription factor [Paenibacillus oleatilyticus]MBU7317103.1 response regulator transcription factor [Paenibacillus oleatilyticus]
MQANEATILLVDDEPTIVRMLKKVLEKEGFVHIDTAATGEEALSACDSKSYDYIVLDVMLPGQSGFEVCPKLRQRTDAPILFLTARSSDLDKLSGFALGGDDYVTKPFNPLEVAARIKAKLRRVVKSAEGPSTQGVYDFGRFRLNELAGELTVEDRRIPCPAQVFQLLLFFCKHPNRIFNKQELYERVWGDSSFSDDNTVMVHIYRIRERIERNPAEPELLVTVRGMGYKLMRGGNDDV